MRTPFKSLENARRLVDLSDELQGSNFALVDETCAIRDALHALIQLADEQDGRLRRLEAAGVSASPEGTNAG